MGRATWSNPFRAARHLPPAVSLEAPVVAAAAASTTTTTAITTATSDNVLLRPVGGVRKKRSKRAAVMSWFGSSFRSALLTAGGGAGGSGTSADATSNSKDRDAPHGLTSVVGATTTAATTTATTTITGSGFGVASLRQQLHHCGNHVAYGASTSPSSTATSFSSTAAPKPSAESNGDAPLPHVHEVNWEGVPETSAAADKDVANSLQTIGTLGNKQVDDEAAMRSASTVDLESGDIHAVNAADVTLTATTTAVEDPARTETRLLARSLLNDYATFYLHPVFKMTYRPKECMDFRRGCFTFRFKHNYNKMEVLVKFLLKSHIPADQWTPDNQGYLIPTALAKFRANQDLRMPAFIHDFEDADMVYVVTHVHGLPKKEQRTGYFGGGGLLLGGSAYYEVEWERFFAS